MYFTTDITSDFSIVGIVRDVKSIFSQLLLPGTRRKYLKKIESSLFVFPISFVRVRVEREVLSGNSQSLLTISAAIVISRETERRKKGKFRECHRVNQEFADEEIASCIVKIGKSVSRK